MILFRDGIAMQRTMAERRWTWQVSISRWPRCVSRKFCSPSRLNYACSRFLDPVIRIPTGIHSSLVIWKFDEFRIDVFRRMDEKKFVTDGEFFRRNQRKIVIHVKLLASYRISLDLGRDSNFLLHSFVLNAMELIRR